MDQHDPFGFVGLTYDDVLLLPGHTDVIPSEADTSSRITRRISVATPLLSSAMDTVTESRMAIAMAREGGIGILHRNLSIADQAAHVDRVKRSESGMITDPITTTQDATVEEVDALCAKYRISGLPVVDDEGRLVGIITNRDMRFVSGFERQSTFVKDVMTRENLVTAPVGVAAGEVIALFAKHRVEKLPLIDEDGKLAGLITIKDFDKSEKYPLATKDDQGRLRVGAAIGFFGDAWERAEALRDAGVDVLVVDTAHGHQEGMLRALQEVASLGLGLPIVAGNIVTADGVRDLVDAGASILKVGVGPGAMCTTRMMTAVGRPQFSAVLETAQAAAEAGAHVWADGGVRYPRDVALALAAGAASVMVGSWFAGTIEAPGELQRDADGRLFKESWGMASTKAVQARFGRLDAYERARKELFAEGISSSKIYLDPLRPGIEDLLDMITSGVRSSFTYAGAATVPEFHDRALVGLQSAAGYEEGKALPVSW